MDYHNNLQLLKKYHNINIDESEIVDNENYKVEITKDNKNIIRVNKNNKWLYLGSKYRQEEEIEKFLSDFEFKDAESYYVVIGFGIGEHIEELLKRLGMSNKVIILEPDIEIIKHAMQLKDFRQLIIDERIKIATYKNKSDINEILSKYIDKSFVRAINVNFYTNYDKIYSYKVSEAYETIKNYYNIMLAERNTISMFSEKVINCYFDNLPTVLTSHSVNDFKNMLNGKTAVIVSSGPSLEKNINELKAYKDKVMIIAGGRSLNELLDAGITPHFICAVDPGDVMHELMKNVINEKIPMICYEQTNNKLITDYKGLKIFSSRAIPNTIEKITGRKFENLPVGGSVAHLCTSFAVYTGVKNVIFVGQDLAYTNMKQHSSASSNSELLNFENPIAKNSVWVDGNNGEKVYASETLNIFRVWFEAFIKHNPNTIFINCTEGGAKIEGALIKTLKETLTWCCDENISISKIVKEKIGKPLDIDLNNVIQGIKELRNHLINIKSYSEKAMKLSKQMQEYYTGNNTIKITKILKKLDDIDKFINKDEEIMSIINIYEYNNLEIISLSEEYKEKIGETDSEKGKRISKKDQRLYSTYISGVEKLIPLVEELISKMCNEAIKYGK